MINLVLDDAVLLKEALAHVDQRLNPFLWVKFWSIKEYTQHESGMIKIFDDFPGTIPVTIFCEKVRAVKNINIQVGPEAIEALTRRYGRENVVLYFEKAS